MRTSDGSTRFAEGVLTGIVFMLAAGLLVFLLDPGARAASRPARFNAAHAAACRALHVVVPGRRDAALAVLACAHEDPDAWRAALRVRLEEVSAADGGR